MDTFLLFKAWAVGMIWGGSLYFVAAYGLHYLPLPQLFRMRQMLQHWVVRLSRNKPERAERWAGFVHVLAKFIMVLVWLALLVFFWWGLWVLLPNYVAEQQLATEQGWVYWLVAGAMPSVLALIPLRRFWRADRIETQSLQTLERVREALRTMP